MAYSPLLSLIVGGVVLATVLLDFRHRRRRDWLHWLGVTMIATNALTSVAWWVWSYVLNYLA